VDQREQTLQDDTFKKAFPLTIPVLLGYLAIGIAFGLLVEHAGYPWYLAFLMSAFIYAGAGQYIGIGMLAAGAGLVEFAAVTLLVNSRHMVYGLSLIRQFKDAKPFTPYLIFALTDETYALLTSMKVPKEVDRPRFFFFIALLNQIYWVAGSVLGFFLGRMLPFSTEGLGFALTALFVVLLMEQWKVCKEKLPFFIALLCGVAALVFLGPGNMLIGAIFASTAIVLFGKGRFIADGNH
jgi:4-azaleucine resistance transporter AzlC